MNPHQIPHFFGLFFLITPIFAAPAIYKIPNFYPVTGISEDEVRQQLNNSGPIINNQHFDAQTLWHINWDYTWHYDNPSQNPCYVTNTNVTVTITLLLPNWINQSSVPINLQNKWDNYLIALQNHEKQHENNAINAAKDIESVLLNSPKMSSCELLKEKINLATKEILNKHHLWDTQYDITTNHGKNEGASFP
ncbi:DUF922 domain-containing protein [Legionella hackeliae]|uniref:DUF922 domain-containing protein n=1 Tax=Legionella hackeliae TaxID=449 RepID=A0A0A8URV1_LEGHA|nr:DUF922 domain-containing protein [Legionella hackeliae]KTD10323.1 hypothetical protein Lhac_2691 [Legionella hackeliae]CEK09822.1 protein of unknown function [Legionella hackeliae]STX49731.1 Predicted secreted Zn-dependent protease [Legionella hackeliae]